MPRREADQVSVREARHNSKIIERIENKISTLESHCNTEWKEIRIQELQELRQGAQKLRNWYQEKIITG